MRLLKVQGNRGSAGRFSSVPTESRYGSGAVSLAQPGNWRAWWAKALLGCTPRREVKKPSACRTGRYLAERIQQALRALGLAGLVDRLECITLPKRWPLLRRVRAAVEDAFPNRGAPEVIPIARSFFVFAFTVASTVAVDADIAAPRR